MKIMGKPNQTLLGHLNDCLTICDEVIQRHREFLCRFCDRYNWNWPEVQQFMRFAVWFHDIGKSSDQWQSYIKTEKGRITHALTSFAISMGSLKMNPEKFQPTPAYAAILAILSHHTQLYDSAFQEEENRINVDLPLWFIEEHLQIFKNKGASIDIAPWKLKRLDLGRAAQALDRIKPEIANLKEKPFKALYSLMLNMITACDGAASGILSNQDTGESLFESIITKEGISDKKDMFPFYDNSPVCQLPFVKEPNSLQMEILKCQDDRLILNAGCGEGKTAAALLFAQKLMRQDRIERIILTLPTKFTANNLFRDLMEKYKIPREIIGITHGDSYEFLRQLNDRGEDNESNLLSQEFENSFYARPVTISTVDHLLMSLYHGYKFADRAFFNVLSSLVVFDEVHYYEGRTLEAIGEAMKLLTQLKVPHLLMTATIPSSIRRQMDNLCRNNGYPFLRASSFIPNSANHKKPFEIVPLESPFFDQEKQFSREIIQKIQQNSQLRQIIYVNQVRLAKIAYKTLKEQGLYDNLICHHAGFTSHDRQRKERLIRILFKPRETREEEEIKDLEEAGLINSDSAILISTQVSELSLDISADVMYSELAPVDSLVQRGGRLHRNGWTPNGPCGCKICKENHNIENHIYRLYIAPPYQDEKSCLPYESDILKLSWEALESPYSFDDACKWVDKVYPESKPLSHPELAKAIQNDMVFGKKPEENYAKDPDEQGRIVIRERQYLTLDVVPYEFAPLVEEDYRQYRSHHVSINAGAFFEAKKGNIILPREGNMKFITRKGKIFIKKIPFLAINARYSFDIGIELDEEAVSNLL